MKNENRLAPITMTNSTPLTMTEVSMARTRSAQDMRRPTMPSRIAPNAPTEAASVGLNTPA